MTLGPGGYGREADCHPRELASRKTHSSSVRQAFAATIIVEMSSIVAGRGLWSRHVRPDPPRRSRSPLPHQCHGVACCRLCSLRGWKGSHLIQHRLLQRCPREAQVLQRTGPTLRNAAVLGEGHSGVPFGMNKKSVSKTLGSGC